MKSDNMVTSTPTPQDPLSPRLSTFPPDTSTILKEFRDHLHTCTIHSSDTISNFKPFVRFEKLRRWLFTPRRSIRPQSPRSPTRTSFNDYATGSASASRSQQAQGRYTAPIEDLVEETCIRFDEIGTFITADKLCPNRGREHGKYSGPEFLRIFCILLDMGEKYTWLVECFYRHDNSDHNLPYKRWENVKSDLVYMFQYERRNLTEREIEEIARQFFNHQWKFCPRKLSSQDSDIQLVNRQIVPILNMKKLGKGGTANVYLVETYAEFLENNFLQQLGPTAKLGTPSPLAEKGEPPAEVINTDIYDKKYQFVMKSYKQENERLYLNEDTAFQILRDRGPGIIKCLGSFQGIHFGDNEDEIYHIFLEYADSDLDVYFKEHGPPEFREELEQFWDQLFTVVKATGNVHKWTEVADGYKPDISGCHGDIKPDNILIVENMLKLADPGFSSFWANTTSRSRPSPMKAIGNSDQPDGCTIYSAPEQFRAFYGASRETWHPMTSQDIWSLGCVLSVAVSWVARGYRGILEYKFHREQCLKTLGKGKPEKIINSYLNDPESKSRFRMKEELFQGKLGYFHNGNDVLDIVSRWHSFLRNNILSKFHETTCFVIDLIENHMLVAERNRLTAQEIVEMWENRPPRSPIELSDSDMAIISAIQKFNEDAENNQASLPKPDLNTYGSLPPPGNLAETIQHRKFRKERRAPTLLKVPFPSVQRQVSGGCYVSTTSLPLQEKKHAGSDYRRQRPAPSEEHRNHASQAPSALANLGGKGGQSSYYEQSQSLGVVLSENGEGGALPNSKSPAQRRHNRGESVMIQDEFESLNNTTSNSSIDTLYQALFGFRRRPKLKKIAELEKHLKSGNKDFIIIVDNSHTMHTHWHKLTKYVQTLAGYLALYDKDGIEIFFGDSKDDWKRVKGKDAFKDAGLHLRARPNPESSKVIDMRMAIQNQCRQHFDRENWQRQNGKLKTTTILILTDGAWAEDADAQLQLEEQLKKSIKFSTSREEPANHPLTFGFIYWTESTTVIDYLKRLDEDIASLPEIPDVIDCVDAESGDLIKMILGSFDPYWDEQGEAERQAKRDSSASLQSAASAL